MAGAVSIGASLGLVESHSPLASTRRNPLAFPFCLKMVISITSYNKKSRLGDVFCVLRSRKGSSMFLTFPVDAVNLLGQMKRRVMGQLSRALVAAEVEGVVMEVCWGLVESKWCGLPGYL